MRHSLCLLALFIACCAAVSCHACVQIGQHFSRFGKVMDVVLVKDFGPLLNLASTATALEQQRRAAEDRLARGHHAGEPLCAADAKAAAVPTSATAVAAAAAAAELRLGLW
jgi:hypothetical protein